MGHRLREEDRWEADVLPIAVTSDLDDFVQALRRQPSIGGTIGFAGVGDDFWLAARVLGEDCVVPLRPDRRRWTTHWPVRCSKPWIFRGALR